MTRSSPSDESTEPDGADDLSSRDAALFGFDDDANAWLDRLREAQRDPALGTIGGYVVEEEVGRGGQGEVYLEQFKMHVCGYEKHSNPLPGQRLTRARPSP